VGKGGKLAYPGLADAELAACHRRSQLTCGDNRFALGQPGQQLRQVGFLDYFEVLVRGRILGSDNTGCGIKQGYSLLIQERYEGILIVGFLLLPYKVHLVAKEAQAKDAPHVVGEIWVVKVNAPPLWRRWESTKHQQLGVSRQKGLEGMALSTHFHFLWREDNYILVENKEKNQNYFTIRKKRRNFAPN
jgi:hypothetical protein